MVGIARVGEAGSGIVPAIPDHLEFVRIEFVFRKGVVPADLVRQLSYDRADSVRKEILIKYKFDPNKFKVLGNGWDNPVPTMTDASNPDHNKKNRRVEVKVFPLEKE